jgi:uncharacterized protein (DUF1684 family)
VSYDQKLLTCYRGMRRSIPRLDHGMKSATKLESFRAAKDSFYARDRRAPLTSEQKRGFKGLAYFPVNTSLVINAKIDRKVDPGIVRVETTKGEHQEYRRYGVVRFEVDGRPAQVTLYASDHSHNLFLPFRDATSDQETYGAGRYLDLHADGDEIVLDFNYAYNPNCAYNPDWSCPLPPAENWLKVPIRAGEMKFPDHASDSQATY